VVPRQFHRAESAAKSAMLSLQQAAVRDVYAKDEMLRVLFNSILKAFTDLGLDMPNKVAPISEQETRWGKY
jgi:hypothetical protein